MSAKKSNKKIPKPSNRNSRFTNAASLLFKISLIVALGIAIYKGPFFSQQKEKSTHQEIKTPVAAKKVSQPRILGQKPLLKEPVFPFSLKKKRILPAKPQIVIIIDDMGLTKKHLKQLQSLGNQVTYAVLPQVPYSQFFGNLSLKTKADVIVHLPLESENNNNPGPGLITTQMSYEQIVKTLEKDLASVPYHKGMNNHMGSKGTSNTRLMRIILTKTREKGLFFLDSRTTPDSVVMKISDEMGLPPVKRDVFLDNVETEMAIRKQIDLLAQKAKRNGYAVGIGHYKATTLKVLNEEIPKLNSQGFEMISISEFLKQRGQ